MAASTVVFGMVAGAVWMLSSGGVELGRRLAPPVEEPAASGDLTAGGTVVPSGPAGAPGSTPDGPGNPSPDGGTPGGRGVNAGDLPDRAQPPGAPGPTTDPPVSSAPGGSGADGPGAPGGADSQAVDYPGVWPYASLAEVGRHMGGSDTRYRTPEDTAARFANDVVGLRGSIAEVDHTGPHSATVELVTEGGNTSVRLTNRGPEGVQGEPPWSVIDAVGGIGVVAPDEVTGPSFTVTAEGVDGAVGVHDRNGWRALAVVVASRTQPVRLDPGRPGPALVVAIAGDPRAPSSFATRRIVLRPRAGSAVPPAPSDAVAATRALSAAAAQGDLGHLWELLSAGPRAELLDWRGLAARLPAWRSGLDMFGAALDTATVSTDSGTVAIVTPLASAVPDDGAARAALAFLLDGGARLASLDPAAITWTDPTPDRPSVVAAAGVRPALLMVDGQVWPTTPSGAQGIAGPVNDLRPGRHLVVALTVEAGRVAVAGHVLDLTGPSDDTGPTGPTGPTNSGPTGTAGGLPPGRGATPATGEPDGP